MRSRWNLPVYIVYVIFCCLVIGFIIGQMGLTFPWQHPYRVTATFRTGDGILVNNEVFMNGIKVGKVSQVQAVNGLAQVDMVIDNEHAVPLYQNAAAQVRKKNLLGETYIDVNRGTADSGQMKADAATIPVEHTLQTVQIDEVLAILDPQTRDRLKLLINGAGDALNGRGADMNASAHTANQFVTALNGPAAELSARQQQLDDIVLELQRLYDMLAKQRDQVRDEFGTWNQVMAQLAAQDTAIGGTLQQADALLQSLDVLITGEIPNLQATLQQLPTALTSTSNFLTQSNDILGGLASYRRSIHDVFPDLGTSFADTLPSGQHLWSVFGVSCSNSCSSNKTTSGANAPNATWAAVFGSSQ
jgi:phospholipid/cholesterol/gamma-HCH transport system substrate-binding protein